MRIEVKGRNLHVSDDAQGTRRQALPQDRPRRSLNWRSSRSSSPKSATRPISDSKVAEATLHLKGVTLRARDSSADLIHSINLCADELAVQVKRHRDKRRKRRSLGWPRAKSCRGHLAGRLMTRPGRRGWRAWH